LIVVDASALLAIALEEPDNRLYAAALGNSDSAHISPANFLQTSIILIRRGFAANREMFETWLVESGVTVRDDLALAGDALAAYLRFGKGFHPARLNLADCFAYALARQLDAPLLYKGDDFAKTDIRSALQST
jgi:ribonuclease VapC